MAEKKPLNVFRDHNVILESSSGGQANGDCPFCGGVKKFYVNEENGYWDCKSCGREGGIKTFLKERVTFNCNQISKKQLIALAKNRGLHTSTLRAWKVGWDGDQYTFPSDACGNLYDVRRYQINRRVMSTSGSKSSLTGIVNGRSSRIWICEGEWDGMALWECLKKSKSPDSVVCLPGANNFPNHAIDLFADKEVFVCLDNDTPGEKGTYKVLQRLEGLTKSIQFVNWPSSFPEGFDFRDLYLKDKDRALKAIKNLLSATCPGEPILEPSGTDSLEGKGLSVKKVIAGFREGLYLPDPTVLSVLFGAVFANRLEGDPLWLFLVAPPGGSKTELLMSLSESPLISTTSSLTPHALISGANMVGGGDPSLVPKLDERVLIVKDFTTILSMPANKRDEIFGILRDAYDGQCEKFFGNGIHRAYESKFGIIAGVTPIIESFSASSSMLGERFIRFRLKHGEQVKNGEAIIMAAIAGISSENKLRDGLKVVAQKALSRKVDLSKTPTISNSMAMKITRLAQWVASLRGVVNREKYTNIVQSRPTREVGTRLAKQFAKLGIGIAIFHNLPTVDDLVYRIVIKVARSTVPDRIEEVVKHLFLRSQKQFASAKEISKWSNLPQQTTRALMEDATLLKISHQDPKSMLGGWKLSNAILRLMRPLQLYKDETEWIGAKKDVKRKNRRQKLAVSRVKQKKRI